MQTDTQTYFLRNTYYRSVAKTRVPQEGCKFMLPFLQNIDFFAWSEAYFHKFCPFSYHKHPIKGQSGWVQWTLWQILMGANAPTAPVLALHLYYYQITNCTSRKRLVHLSPILKWNTVRFSILNYAVASVRLTMLRTRLLSYFC